MQHCGSEGIIIVLTTFFDFSWIFFTRNGPKMTKNQNFLNAERILSRTDLIDSLKWHKQHCGSEGTEIFSKSYSSKSYLLIVIIAIPTSQNFYNKTFSYQIADWDKYDRNLVDRSKYLNVKISRFHWIP